MFLSSQITKSRAPPLLLIISKPSKTCKCIQSASPHPNCSQEFLGRMIVVLTIVPLQTYAKNQHSFDKNMNVVLNNIHDAVLYIMCLHFLLAFNPACPVHCNFAMFTTVSHRHSCTARQLPLSAKLQDKCPAAITSSRLQCLLHDSKADVRPAAISITFSPLHGLV